VPLALRRWSCARSPLSLGSNPRTVG
jgi:hypothetical protein